MAEVERSDDANKAIDADEDGVGKDGKGGRDGQNEANDGDKDNLDESEVSNENSFRQ